MIMGIAIAGLVLLAGYSALMLFYFSGWLRTREFSATSNFSPRTKVSVVIAARNEEQNIERCIRSVLKQHYPKHLLEVIVVDDHSEDNTFKIAQSLAHAPQLVVLSLAEFIIAGNKPRSFKKKAIETGISKATGELIVTTDADCIAGASWLSTVVAYYENFHPKMIAGPVAFDREEQWIEKWQSLDLCGMMSITAGAITNGFPNMCNGANLAYEKKAFESVNGFEGIDEQPSGDDVMLMMKMHKAHPGSVHFLRSRGAVVYTKPEGTLRKLFYQRVRWLSKGTAFPDWRVSFTLVFAWTFNVSLLANFIGGFFMAELWILAGAAFLVKTAAEFPLLWSGCTFFGKRKLLWNILPAQILHILYVVCIGAASRIFPYQWKGRG